MAEAAAAAAAAATFQVLVRGLDGRTACLQFSSNVIPGFRLQECLSRILGIPTDVVRIVTGTTEITSQNCLVADHDGVFPSCNLLLRLRGGKGGFGSLLRGAATKAGQKKTSNFDACRDMSGRRLRHVNAEKKLKEWKAEAKERELEKTAEAYLKKQMKRKEEESGVSKELEKYREETSKAMEEVESAVERGLAEAKRFGKRNKVEAVVTDSKRARIWMIDEDIANEGVDVEADLFVKEVYHFQSGECSKGLKTSEVDNDVEQGSLVKEHYHTQSGECSKGLNDGLVSSTCSALDSEGDVEGPEFGGSIGVGSGDSSNLEDGNSDIDSSGLLLRAKSLTKSPCGNAVAMVASGQTASATSTEQLNFGDFQTAEEMEVLGLERLKCELQARGLKCGGSLAERATRLFLLKTIPLEKLDKKQFAKIKAEGKWFSSLGVEGYSLQFESVVHSNQQMRMPFVNLGVT